MFVSELLRNRRLNFESQQRLRASVETSPAAILIMDRSGVINLANQAATEMFASSGTCLIGQPIGMFVPELQNASAADGAMQFRASMRCEVRRGDRETFVAEVWFSTYKEKALAGWRRSLPMSLKNNVLALLPAPGKRGSGSAPV